MTSRYANILTLIAAILAFLPVMGIDWLISSYVRGKEEIQLSTQLGSITDRIDASALEAMNTLDHLVADSASLCTPTFLASARSAIETGLYVKNVSVTSGDGVEYCDALGADQHFAPVTETLSVPGKSQALTVGRLADGSAPVLRFSQVVGARTVSVFTPLVAATPQLLLNRFRPLTLVRMSFTNGVQLMTAGDGSAYDRTGGADYLVSTSIAANVPIRAEAAVPFAIVKADYADLTMTLTMLACVMSGAFLVMALQFVRRSKLPAFDLERAIAAGEIKPYYQPVINLRTGELSGCEVLCRWEKRNGELVMPGTFIDFAEITGLAIPMTLSLMQQVKSDLSELCSRRPDLKISINLFEGHFRDSHIISDVQAIFGNSNISFRQLVFEITERRPIGNSDTARTVIAGMHKLGVRLAMDDVGTGHSNLAYMQTLGVDVIKIDKVFVDMIKAETKVVPVLDGLIAMCRDLGTDIVAEGVETEAQALYLRARGVVMAQGYLFAPALKVKSFLDLANALTAQHTEPAEDSNAEEVTAAA